MESSSHERACPSCSAPAQSDQRWCLECGAELPQRSKRSGLRPAVGIATTLTVLVGAASAGGYTLLQDGKKPPPPATTVAQQPPPAATTPAVPETATPPVTETPVAPPAGRETPRLPDTSGGSGGGTPPSNDVPDVTDDVDTSTPNPPPPDDNAGEVDNGDGSVTDEPSNRDRRTRQPKPRLVETNIALGAVAVVYPPSATGEDLGDAGAVVDGSSSTAWKTPRYDDPATNPQLGVYVDLASAERLTKLVVTSPTPGVSVEVYAARNGPPRSITSSGWAHVADKTLAGRSTIELSTGAEYRYVLLWVTGLPAGADHGAISEVQIFSKQPE
ncbi:hypothetical protein [Conexibacter woesei]|uniref:F5/8 type C domain-containing protein n=1 Tax=Conexibacter woesei (strain DSM 14684 / CCUG 47730 / CIP 108061 / JCM 11494 / NBRC 100937 / ID131577) TaxID=469383 RepID=D3FDV8_CONWI|nr:hypothetical protein [Conexibacter woesei]ADB51574.1 hypothetical protein Cwoe_3155 [Conexibacter woesei DSM 14684]